MSVRRKQRKDLTVSLSEIAKDDGRYDVHVFQFLLESLTYSQQLFGKNIESENEEERHVTGQELCEGIRRHALEQFGFMAKTVFEGWGIHTTDDFGEIVYLLIRNKLMAKRESDSIGDFHNVYCFDTAFDDAFAFEKGEKKKSRRGQAT